MCSEKTIHHVVSQYCLKYSLQADTEADKRLAVTLEKAVEINSSESNNRTPAIPALQKSGKAARKKNTDRQKKYHLQFVAIDMEDTSNTWKKVPVRGDQYLTHGIHANLYTSP